MGDRHLWRHHLRRLTELRWLSRRVSYPCTLQGLHLQGPQTLLPQPLLTPTLQFTLHKAAEAANHDNKGPNQPESSKARQECVGTLGHHHDCILDNSTNLSDPAGKTERSHAFYIAEVFSQVSKPRWRALKSSSLQILKSNRLDSWSGTCSSGETHSNAEHFIP